MRIIFLACVYNYFIILTGIVPSTKIVWFPHVISKRRIRNLLHTCVNLAKSHVETKIHMREIIDLITYKNFCRDLTLFQPHVGFWGFACGFYIPHADCFLKIKNFLHAEIHYRMRENFCRCEKHTWTTSRTVLQRLQSWNGDDSSIRKIIKFHMRVNFIACGIKFTHVIFVSTHLKVFIIRMWCGKKKSHAIKKIACDKKKRMRFYIIFNDSISVISSHAEIFYRMRLFKHTCEIHSVDISTQKTHFWYFHMWYWKPTCGFLDSRVKNRNYMWEILIACEKKLQMREKKTACEMGKKNPHVGFFSRMRYSDPYWCSASFITT